MEEEIVSYTDLELTIIEQDGTVEEDAITVDEEGQHWYKGFKLPPDNSEPWDAEQPGLAGAAITNAYAREVNIRTIDNSGQPLFIRWEDVDLSGMERGPSRFQRMANWLYHRI